MKRLTLILVTICLMNMVARGQTPSTQPALPAGHPDISQMIKPAAPSGSLPAGHPDISQMMQSPSSGGTTGSAMPGRVNLPAGLPDLSAAAPTTQTSVVGTLKIVVVQGTANGPAIGTGEFVAQFRTKGQLIQRVQGKLGTNGTALIENLPLVLVPEPIVEIIHDGVEYQVTGPALDAANPNQELKVVVNETTEQKPDWQIAMRHIMVQPVEGGLQVTEMLSLDTAGDRAWRGDKSADGKRITFALALPKGVKNLQLISGLHSYATELEDNVLVSSDALIPGSRQCQISYLIPAKDGAAEITVSTPATMKHLLVFIPDDGTTVKAQGLEALESSAMGTDKTRIYRAGDVIPGTAMSLAVSGISVGTNATAAISNVSNQAAQIVAGVGAAVILLFGVAFVFIKGAPAKRGMSR